MWSDQTEEEPVTAGPVRGHNAPNSKVDGAMLLQGIHEDPCPLPKYLHYSHKHQSLTSEQLKKAGATHQCSDSQISVQSSICGMRWETKFMEALTTLGFKGSAAVCLGAKCNNTPAGV